MIKQFTKTFLLLLLFYCCYSAAAAQSINVAIAANLQPAMKVIQKDFKAKTGIDISVISGSSGNLAAQIRNGAPFDVFMSADTDFPLSLQRDGFGLKPAQVYAGGVLIICSKQRLNFNNWQLLLQSHDIKKIAVGNPKIAPYGKAAQEALTKAGLYQKLQEKLVSGESISQVNTYITTGVVQAGFTSLSLVKDPANPIRLTYAVVDAKSYAPIQQSMLLLKHAEGNGAAEKFYQFIFGASAKKVFRQFGYHIK